MLSSKRAFQMKGKVFFIIFKGRSFEQIKSPTLGISFLH